MDDVEKSFHLDLVLDRPFLFEGEYLECALPDGLLNDVTHITITSHRRKGIYHPLPFGSASGILAAILEYCPNLSYLELNYLALDLFSALPTHPPPHPSLKTLKLAFLELSDDDIVLLGPCFPSVTTLIWRCNSFNEACYEAYVSPYFETIEYHNGAGWYPGCEIWGDGQVAQVKNIHVHYLPLP